jgi:spermidine synthase
MPQLITFLLYLAVFFSGMASLIHEVLWARLFALCLGSSADSATAVLVSFMTGLGIGAYISGKIEQRLKNPLFLFVGLQILIGFFGLFMYRLTQGYVFGLSAYVLRHSSSFFLRFLIATWVMVLPVMAMGALLPLCIRTLVLVLRRLNKSSRLFSRASAGLIAVNTLGSFIGTIYAGYYLIPLVGLKGGANIGSFLNFISAALGVGIFVLAKKSLQGLPEAELKPDLIRNKEGWSLSFACIIAAIAGFLIFSLEIIWRRILVLMFGHDSYGFSTMVSVVIAGLAIGSGLAYLKLRTSSLKPGHLSFLFIIMAVAIPFFAFLGQWTYLNYGLDPLGIVGLPSKSEALYKGLILQMILGFITIFVPSFISGFILPWICFFVRPLVKRSGFVLASIFAANSIGCVFGVVFSAFCLVSMFGIDGSIVVLSLLSGLVGIMILLRFVSKARLRYLGGSLFLLFSIFFIYPANLSQRVFLKTAGGDHLKLIFYKEGRTSTVGVTKDTIDGERQLLINGVNEVSTRFVHDQSFALLGHLGLLLHPNPKKVLVICYGAGISAGAALTHGPESVEIVDIEADVVEASKSFNDLNENVLKDSSVSLIIEDGRFYLASTSSLYEVIIVDSTHPRSIDSWMLYTTEFYKKVKHKLKEKGILVQWVPMHGMTEAEFKIILATFLKEFPQAQLWANVGFDARGFAGYALMVGSPSGKIPIDKDLISKKLKRPRVKKNLSRWLLATFEDIRDCFIAEGAKLRSWVDKVPIATDNRPIIPFVSRWSKAQQLNPSMFTRFLSLDLYPEFSDFPSEDKQKLKDFLGGVIRTKAITPQPSVIPLEFRLNINISLSHLLLDKVKLFVSAPSLARAIARGLLFRGEIEEAQKRFPYSSTLKRYLKEKKKAIDYYKALARRFPKDLEIIVKSGRILRELGDVYASIRILKQALKIAPSNKSIMFELALSYERKGKIQKAIAIYERLLRLDSNLVPAMNNLALLRGIQGNFKEAKELILASIDQDAEHFYSWIALGIIESQRQRVNSSLKAFKKALSLFPEEPSVYNHIGFIYYLNQNFKEAQRSYQEALRLDPFWSEPTFRTGLVWLARKDYRLALSFFKKALLLDPYDSLYWSYIGLTLSLLGIYDQGIAAHLISLEIDSNLSTNWVNFGFSYKKAGKLKAAEACFKEALKIRPELIKQILK